MRNLAHTEVLALTSRKQFQQFFKEAFYHKIHLVLKEVKVL